MDDLRDRLIRALYAATWDSDMHPVDDAPEVEIVFTGQQVDALLDELCKTHRLVPR
jgi:hypothetical protein